MAYNSTPTLSVWSDPVTCINQGAYNDTTATITDDYACFHFFRMKIHNTTETDGVLNYYIY